MDQSQAKKKFKKSQQTNTSNKKKTPKIKIFKIQKFVIQAIYIILIWELNLDPWHLQQRVIF